MPHTNPIDFRFISALKGSQAHAFRAIPFAKTKGVLQIWGDALTLKKQGVLEMILGEPIAIHQQDEETLTRQLLTHYPVSASLEMKTSKGAEADLSGSEVVQFVQKIMQDAAEMQASDIHIERYETRARIRFRWDGQLLEKYEVPLPQYNAVLSRIKIMADLDIAERRLPQDGRINLRFQQQSIDIRVSTIPGKYGEKAVLRLLTRSQEHLQIDRLGLSPAEHQAYLHAIERPNGLVLITGPTGSGKTTTLYASLNHLNQPAQNILTIEDPVEYNLEGVNQVQLKADIGLSFDRALRAFLRQDPDIIMVGEIRDPDTARIAIRAALTGHLVLSTLHTNSAWDAVSRLVDMGVEAYLLAAALRLVAAQRLVRTLCPDCKQETHAQLDPALQDTYGLQRHFLPVGCPSCHYTGHLGRQAVFELLPIAPSQKLAIKTGADMPIRENVEACPPLGENMARLVRDGQISLSEMRLNL